MKEQIRKSLLKFIMLDDVGKKDVKYNLEENIVNITKEIQEVIGTKAESPKINRELTEKDIDDYLTVAYYGEAIGRAGREILKEDEIKTNKILLSYELVKNMCLYVLGGLLKDGIIK